MAPHRTSSRHRARGTALLAAFALAGSLVAISPAAGDAIPAPTTTAPTSSDEAKAAWVEAARGAEQLNQSVLLAQENVTTQQANATVAQQAAEATVSGVAAAASQVAAADAALAVFQPKLDALANASLKGARLSALSSLLTADSATAYLDQVTAMDQVSGDTMQTLASAKVAKATAVAAASAAQQARTTAQQAADTAAGAVLAAQQAVADLAGQQESLKDTITSFEKLYTSLSLSERGAAIDEFQNSYLSPEAKAQLALETAQSAAAGVTDRNVSELSVRLAPDTASGIAVAAALSRRGLPYVWGDVGPRSFDCSGLMLWAWEQAGITIPRTSSGQSNLPEVPLDQLLPGDLVTYYVPVSHVGMYIGNGLVVEASTTTQPVKVIELHQSGPNPTGHRVPR